MEHQITIVGIGPGNPEYLPPIAARAIQSANILIGSRRALISYASNGQETRVIDGNIEELIVWMRHKIQQHDMVVLVSGDPGYFSLLDVIRRELQGVKIQVIPGISSFQVAFAKLGLPWHNATLLSFHGREPSEAQLTYHSGRLISLLTDGKNNPTVIALKLCDAGWPLASQVWLCRELTYDSEQILAGTLSDIKGLTGYESCVMVVQG